jgi:hypothetical protein
MMFYVASVENKPDNGSVWFEQTMIEADSAKAAMPGALSFARGIPRPVGTRQEVTLYGPFELGPDSRVMVQAVRDINRRRTITGEFRA